MNPLRRSRFDAEIARLAVPALGALAADPLVSLVDTAFVGRLGAGPLGALAVAAAVFGLAFVVFNFLAFGTTPRIAASIGRGDRAGAAKTAVTALALGVGLGLATAALLAVAARPVLQLMGAGADLLPEALTYLRLRLIALPAVLLVTVGHGVFRGYQDTRTPLVVTVGLNLVNLVLDPLLIFTAGLGIAGAALATVAAQWTGAVWFLYLLVRRRGARFGLGGVRPAPADVGPLLRAGGALVVRTAALLGVLSLATAVVARQGTVEVAAHQVAIQLWLFLSLVLDSLAIAAQAMVGRHLAMAGPHQARAVSARLLVLGLGAGAVLAIAMGLAAPVLPQVFTDDPSVVAAVRSVYMFVVLMQPLNALVFVWDGIVMGVTDFAYLAGAMWLAALTAAAVLAAVLLLDWGLPGVWWAMVALMALRAGTMWWWLRHGPLGAEAGHAHAFRAA